MICKILQRGSPQLTTSCKEIYDPSSVQNIIQDLRDTIENFKKSYNVTRDVGLAAPQIGKLIQLSVIENKFGKQYVMINPRIVDHSAYKTKMREGCLSFLEVRGNVPRYSRVSVEALNEIGKPYSLTAHEPDFAMLLQHEVDHLHGILYTDHLKADEALYTS